MTVPIVELKKAVKEYVNGSLRVTALGGRILHVPLALVLHKVSASLMGDTPRKSWLRSRSHIIRTDVCSLCERINRFPEFALGKVSPARVIISLIKLWIEVDCRFELGLSFSIFSIDGQCVAP